MHQNRHASPHALVYRLDPVVYCWPNASKLAAKNAGLPRSGTTSAVKGQQWVPFEDQTPVYEPEKVFRIADGVYLGSEYGAASRSVFAALGIGVVINITNGSRAAPNHFEDLT